MNADLLTEVIAKLTERVTTTEHSHMLKPWEMVFGGLVLPLLAEMDESVKSDPNYLEMQERYSKAKVEEFFAPKVEVTEKIRVEKIETIKVIEKIVGGAGMTRMPTLHGTVTSGDKFRRLKGTVAKVSRKVNDIPPDGRDAINGWWNANQRLTNSGDCQPIADYINRTNPNIHPLSAAQVSGWVSWLCRLALKTSADRADYVTRSLNKGKFSVAPLFSTSFINEIANNKLNQAEDRRLAAEAKARMTAEVEAAMKCGAAPVTA